MGEIVCIACGKEFEDYRGLALHIATNKKGHSKGRKWAAKYLNRQVLHKRQYDNNGRSGMTAEDKANKEDTRRVLSGDTEYANTICPKCNKPSRPLLEVEHTSNPQAWRIGGRLAKMCDMCGGI